MFFYLKFFTDIKTTEPHLNGEVGSDVLHRIVLRHVGLGSVVVALVFEGPPVQLRLDGLEEVDRRLDLVLQDAVDVPLRVDVSFNTNRHGGCKTNKKLKIFTFPIVAARDRGRGND
jgi:hypothetical protein